MADLPSTDRAWREADRRPVRGFRPLLPAVRVSTLVLNRRGDPIGPPEAGRYMAERIPGSRFVELVGDHVMWLGDVASLCGEIEEFITGLRPGAREPGSVMAILQCDIEGSTALARESDFIRAFYPRLLAALPG